MTTNNLTTGNLARNPRCFTPKPLAEKILQSKAALEWTTRHRDTQWA